MKIIWFLRGVCMKFSKTFFLLLIIFGGVPFSSLFSKNERIDSILFSEDERSEDENFDSIGNHPVNKEVVVTVSNINGPILITGHEHNTIVLKITKRGNKNHFKHVHADVKVTREKVSIESRYDNRNDRQNVSIEYELTVPRHAVLEKIKTVNGGIAVTGVYGPITTKTANGKITIEGSQSSLSAHTVNGTIDLTIPKFSPNQTIRAQSINGAITCSLPETVSTKLHAKTTTGTISSDFNISIEKVFYIWQEVRATLGKPKGAKVSLETTNGAIDIKKIS